VPAHGARPEAFAPAGWKIAAQAPGDLDGDGRADRVLHLVPRDTPSSSDGPEAQALVILLAASGGGWRRGGVAVELLPPAMPQWELRLTIRRGVLIVHQRYGMATVWEATHRFRRDARSGQFLLIGQDGLAFHRPSGMYDTRQTSENYLTGVRLVTTGHLRGGGYHMTTRREPVPRARTTFQEARAWDGD